MISDTLFEALIEIERYQKEQPDTYANFEAQIEETKAAMRRLLNELDTPPTQSEKPA